MLRLSLVLAALGLAAAAPHVSSLRGGTHGALRHAIRGAKQRRLDQRDFVDPEDIVVHLKALEEIAKRPMNNGTRSVQYGYNRSVAWS